MASQPPTPDDRDVLANLSSLPEGPRNLLRLALADRVTGCLVGSAVGDAIGLYTEFFTAARAAVEYPEAKFTLHPTPTHFSPDLHRCKHAEGEWTDDTDHSLLLLLSFLNGSGGPGGPARGLPSQQDFAKRLKLWVSDGLRALDRPPLGLGALVGSVVRSPDYEEKPQEAATERWRRSNMQAAPNGALMRTHPLGLMLVADGDEARAFSLAAEISRATHVDPRCVVSCVIGTGLVRACARGEVATEQHVDDLIARARAWYESEGVTGGGSEGTEWPDLDWDELTAHVNPADGLDGLKLDESGKIGYTYKTLGSGVVCLRLAIRRISTQQAPSVAIAVKREEVFEELITDLTMRAGDADTNACFAGALLGAYLGYSVLPGHWKRGLKNGDWLLRKAEALCKVLGVMDGEYNGRDDPDTEIAAGKPPLTEAESEMRWAVLSGDAQTRITERKTARENAAKERANKGRSGNPVLAFVKSFTTGPSTRPA
ncbi:ADP-ribosylglycohydrolase-domain-containing protein [Cladorrhinum samala]|uniref:ADP-ribosylglycohydrolase-domain-containing protein n=1 Tax=Cladorrhinum samala TaxID=585594 RepID=A0AAV9HSY6_9PEZI|nr:ADP-ribosylglycohydrolase-domain-containing protein [Cladorrhinum samala]